MPRRLRLYLDVNEKTTRTQLATYLRIAAIELENGIPPSVSPKGDTYETPLCHYQDIKIYGSDYPEGFEIVGKYAIKEED